MADRYWVGSGTWDGSNTTNWSTTSGGSGGASVPTSTDNVFFNASSGSCSITTGAVCLNFNSTSSVSAITSVAQRPWVYGSLTLGKSDSISPILQSGSSQTFTPNGFIITDLSNGSGTTIVCSGSILLNGVLNCNQYGQITFLAGSSNYVDSVSANASSGAEFKFRTSSAGTQATLSDTSGVNQLDYTDSKDINFTGGAAWTRGTGFIDSGNNTGLTSSLAAGLFFGDL